MDRNLFILVAGILNENINTSSINVVNLIRTHHTTAEGCPIPHPPSYIILEIPTFSQMAIQEVNVCYIERIPSHTLSKCCMDINLRVPHLYLMFSMYMHQLYSQGSAGDQEAWVRDYISSSFIALHVS